MEISLSTNSYNSGILGFVMTIFSEKVRDVTQSITLKFCENSCQFNIFMMPLHIKKRPILPSGHVLVDVCNTLVAS